MIKTPAYRYRATVHRVVDGDTYELAVDLGFKIGVTLTVRLRGVDCPEMPTRAGRAAKDFVATVLYAPNGAAIPLIVETYRDRQTFARWVADVWLADGRRLADVLLEAGHATVLDIP